MVGPVPYRNRYDTKTGAFSKVYAIRRQEQGKWRLRQHFVTSLVNLMNAEGTNTLVDFGAGIGLWVDALRAKGIQADGYDGIKDIMKITGGVIRQADLSKPFDAGKQWDWTLALDIGEHIPIDCCDVFVENCVRHASHGIVLTWGEPETKGLGHVNCLPIKDVHDLFKRHGFHRDDRLTKKTRHGLPHNQRQTLQVLLRK